MNRATEGAIIVGIVILFVVMCALVTKSPAPRAHHDAIACPEDHLHPDLNAYRTGCAP